MARGDVLQIVVFSMIFAIALGMLGEKGRPVIEFCESLAETMFKFTNIVMKYAPIGVAAAIAYTVGHGGFGVLVGLAWLIATLYIALAVFCPLRAGPGDPALPHPDGQVRPRGQGTGRDRLLDDVERGGAAAGDGSDGTARRAAPDRVAS